MKTSGSPGYSTRGRTPKEIVIPHINEIKSIDYTLKNPVKSRFFNEFYGLLFTDEDLLNTKMAEKAYESFYSDFLESGVMSQTEITSIFQKPVGHLRYLNSELKGLLGGDPSFESRQKTLKKKFERLMQNYLPSSSKAMIDVMTHPSLDIRVEEIVDPERDRLLKERAGGSYEDSQENSQKHFEIEGKSKFGNTYIDKFVIDLQGLLINDKPDDMKPLFSGSDIKKIFEEQYPSVLTKTRLDEEAKDLLKLTKDYVENISIGHEVYANDTMIPVLIKPLIAKLNASSK